VPLSVVMALRPVRPAAIDLREIGALPRPSRPVRPRSALRRRAITVAERWVRERQEADGSWGGIQPPWVWSIVMLAALGYGFEDETLRRAVGGWQGFTIDEGDRLRPEACQSPVWDTALAVLALREAGVSADHSALRAAGDWLYAVPFCDFGKVTDEPSADVTAHALEVLAHEPQHAAVTRRGLDWLLAEQEDDGSWFGRWGVNHVYGTGAALPGLEACGIEPAHPAFRRAVAWLDSVQNEDGGFGEDIRSYADSAWRGRGVSTPSQTA